jgi:hypothetical protein
MSKYLPGLSYGQMGGPWSISWERGRSDPSRESKGGNYTFRFETTVRGQTDHDLDLVVTFWSPSLRAAQAEAKRRAEEIGASWGYYVDYQPAPRP